jgi:2-polyprenyl-3-methyl-5-hydroxy-6-metoxy-1,4-benzoquinol methylase
MSVERDHIEITPETRAIWEHNARWWDEQMGEGNLFQRQLIGPATERLLAPQPGQFILDLACGNGVFSRRLAALDVRVLACDFSAAFLERARARTVTHADRIEYRQIDLTDRSQLLALGERRFDAAVCGMALMDLAALTPLLESLSVLLRPGGRFVFSVLHPSFKSIGSSLVAERVDQGGELRTTHAVQVKRYLSLEPAKGVGIPGQPIPHYYFDRPLSVLFGACFEAGFVMTGLDEPALPATPGARALSWKVSRTSHPSWWHAWNCRARQRDRRFLVPRLCLGTHCCEGLPRVLRPGVAVHLHS